MSKGTRHGIQRAMAWGTLTGGALLVTYWVLYFAGRLDMAHDPVIGAFESAFPIADALFCLVLLSAARSLFAGRRSGPFLLAWAGAICLYLGVLDMTFYAGRGIYSSITATTALELTLNLICIGAGSAALLAAWRLYQREEASRASRTSVDGKVVLVVGAASGIGAAAATRLAEAGAIVGLADIDENALERRRKEISSRGFRTVTFHVDVADADSVEDLVEGALMAFGRVDALVNCAGILHPGAPDRVPLMSLRREVETNLLGTIHTTRALLPYFRRRRAGHLVHIASLGGIVPLPGEATYSATKFAVRGFCQSLALELRGDSVQVSVVHPDSTDTPQLWSEARHDGSSLSFTGQPLAADRVARAIVGALERPRIEIAVPELRGWLAKLGALAPSLLMVIYPLLDRRGRRRRDAFRAALLAGRGEAPEPALEGA